MPKLIFKNSSEFLWTGHAREKMKFYGLFESRLKKVLKRPKRREEGVAPGTIACMQPAGSKHYPHEIWLMYQKVGQKKKIISAWRYPGVSPVNGPIPVPEDILEDLAEAMP